MPAVLVQLLERLIFYLLHLWGAPRGDVPLTCPPPIGDQPPDPVGFFDTQTVTDAFAMTGRVSIAAIFTLVLFCYLATQYTTGPKFVRRWTIHLGISSVVTFLVPLIVLYLWHTHAAVGTCETNPEAFAMKLPVQVVLVRSSAGLVWGPLAFFAISFLLTHTVGRTRLGGGFFHNRGCPWPQLKPGKE